MYLKQHDGFRLGIAMCCEKRVDVGRDRSPIRKRVDVGSDRSLAFIFSGSAAVAAGQSVRRPRACGVRRGGRGTTEVVFVDQKGRKRKFRKLRSEIGAGG